MSPEQLTGLRAQRWVEAQLKKQGLPVLATGWNTQSCDILVGDLPIEVKTANATYRRRGELKYRRWQWRIHETQKYHHREWALILIAEYQGQPWPFIMPGSLVNLRPHLQITSTPLAYSGWMASWLNRWDVIEYLLNGTYKDGGPLIAQVRQN
jgi:hypothetical protein